MPKFTKKFIQGYDSDSNKGYILEVDISYPKRLQKILKIPCFYLKEFRLTNDRNFYLIFMTRMPCITD